MSITRRQFLRAACAGGIAEIVAPFANSASAWPAQLPLKPYTYWSDADAHRKKTFTEKEYGYIYYLTSHAFPAMQVDVEKTLAFAIASTSKQEIIEFCTPQPTGIAGLSYIDLRKLEWDWRQWFKVLETYPYRRFYNEKYPLVIRADWLIAQLIDPVVSDARYRLLYNNANINRDQFVEFWKGNKDAKIWYGIPEGQSGVSVQGKRWIVNLGNSVRSYLWETLDFTKINLVTDPQSNLTYPFIGRFQKAVHDGAELIAGMPKFSMKTGEFGCLQDYFLANQNGARVEEAPGSLVNVKNSSLRNYGAITNFSGCLSCHKTGINPVTENEYVSLLAINPITGEYATAKTKDYDLKLQIDKFNLRNVAADIKHNNALYAAGVLMCNGLTPQANVIAVQKYFRAYDAPVDIQQAAIEFGYPVDELKLAMAWHDVVSNSTEKYDELSLNSRFAVLGKGGAIPRSTFEQIYTHTNVVWSNWVRGVKNKGIWR